MVEMEDAEWVLVGCGDAAEGSKRAVCKRMGHLVGATSGDVEREWTDRAKEAERECECEGARQTGARGMSRAGECAKEDGVRWI